MKSEYKSVIIYSIYVRYMYTETATNLANNNEETFRLLIDVYWDCRCLVLLAGGGGGEGGLVGQHAVRVNLWAK